MRIETIQRVILSMTCWIVSIFYNQEMESICNEIRSLKLAIVL